MLAICLAATAGFHGPGSRAAITFSFLVLWSRACEIDTDSCWFSWAYQLWRTWRGCVTYCTITGHESNLRKCKFKAYVLCSLCISDIGVVIPSVWWVSSFFLAGRANVPRFLWNFWNDQASRNIGNPVCKLDSVRLVIHIWCSRKVKAVGTSVGISICGHNMVAIGSSLSFGRHWKLFGIKKLYGNCVQEGLEQKRTVLLEKNGGRLSSSPSWRHSYLQLARSRGIAWPSFPTLRQS